MREQEKKHKQNRTKSVAARSHARTHAPICQLGGSCIPLLSCAWLFQSYCAGLRRSPRRCSWGSRCWYLCHVGDVCVLAHVSKHERNLMVARRGQYSQQHWWKVRAGKLTHVFNIDVCRKPSRLEARAGWAAELVRVSLIEFNPALHKSIHDRRLHLVKPRRPVPSSVSPA